MRTENAVLLLVAGFPTYLPLPFSLVQLLLGVCVRACVCLPLLGQFVISLVLSHHSKNLKQRRDQCYSSMLQLSFMLTQFYLESKGKYILQL